MKINGIRVTSPKSLQVVISDLDGKSERDANGTMYRDRIAVKRKLSCGWGPLSSVQISLLLQAVRDTFFYVTYTDPMSGVEETRSMYVGDRTSPTLWESPWGTCWGGLTMNFIEK